MENTTERVIKQESTLALLFRDCEKNWALYNSLL